MNGRSKAMALMLSALFGVSSIVGLFCAITTELTVCEIDNTADFKQPAPRGHKDGESSNTGEIVTKTFYWKYHEDDWTTTLRNWLKIGHTNNRSASLTFDMEFCAYIEYVSKTIVRANRHSALTQYATSTEPYIVSLADYFNQLTHSWADLQRINFVLKFVQSIPYARDIDNNGVEEYYSYPLETLWKQKGDCEDHTVLFAAIVKAMGYKVLIAHVPNHVLAAVHIVDGTGSYTTVDGLNYYYCESTSNTGSSNTNRANVGYINPSYVVDAVYVV